MHNLFYKTIPQIHFWLLFLIATNMAFSQNMNMRERVILSQNLNVERAAFLVYSPTYKAKAIYKDTLQAKNNTPEALMSSILSAKNQDWVNYNEFKKRNQDNTKQFEWVKTINTEKNYFELDNKFEFLLNGIETAIIKFFIVQENKAPTSGTKTVQKFNNRWYINPITGMDNISIVLMRFQSAKMQELFDGVKTGNPLMDEVIAKTRNELTALDFDKLQKEYAGWYERKDQKMIDFFIDKRAW